MIFTHLCVLCFVVLIFAVIEGNKAPILDGNSKEEISEESDEDTSAYSEKPLFLTPLIERGQIEQVKNLSKVLSPFPEEIISYSGYLTVNKTSNSNLFFWFFPAQEIYGTNTHSQINFQEAPVILWLQGGPGATSLFGLFTENGPFLLKSSSNLELRNHTWIQFFNVLYIDSPVGTGFSFTDGELAKNDAAVAKDLYVALQQFFKVFPEFQKNDFYVAGESYAGKYIPALCYIIHKNNHKKSAGTIKNVVTNPVIFQEINLKGLIMGNAFIDPIHQMQYGDYLYHIGLIDWNGWEIFKEIEAKGIQMIKNNQSQEAFNLYLDLLDGNNSLFYNLTGFSYFMNYLNSSETNLKTNNMVIFIDSPEVRKALHVGYQMFNVESQLVVDNLVDDYMSSAAPALSELLDQYRVLIYSGQLDIVVAYPLTVNFLRNFRFNRAEEYQSAMRKTWFIGKDVAGYVKTAGNLTEVLVRNAGHMAIEDQPIWVLDLVRKFVGNAEKY